MSERRLWESYLKPLLHRPPSRFARKVQDRFVSGLSDVVYCVEGAAGWLELKWIDRWPRDNGTVNMRLTPAQAAWLTAWRDAGGLGSHVLLGVRQTNEWFLFADAAACLRRFTREQIERMAEARGSLTDLRPLVESLRDRPA